MYFPAEEIIDNGFGIAQFYYEDITADANDFTSGIAPMFERRNDGTDWGKIGMWAFAASRVADILLSFPETERLAVIGHSRLGKTALWCGAQDERIDFVFSNDSGCSGAAYERIKHGGSETIARITEVFPYWFCENYKKFAQYPDTRPFDQHMLLALSAPRFLGVGSAGLDDWADQYSEQLSCVFAGDAWTKIYNKPGFVGPTEAAKIGDAFSSITGSSLTTIAGFLAMCTMQLTLGEDIGIVMAKGVLLGVICTITVLPSLIMTFRRAIEKHTHRTFIPKLKRTSNFVVKHRVPILIAFIMIFIPFFIFLFI